MPLILIYSGEKTVRYLAAIISILAFAHPFSLAAQIPKSTTLAELAVYNGLDREQLLVAGAKKEGKGGLVHCACGRLV